MGEGGALPGPALLLGALVALTSSAPLHRAWLSVAAEGEYRPHGKNPCKSPLIAKQKPMISCHHPDCLFQGKCEW